MHSHYYYSLLFIIYFTLFHSSTVVLSQEDSFEDRGHPRISFISKSQVKDAGDTAYFSCSVKNRGENEVTWLKVSSAGPGQKEIVTVITNGSVLVEDQEPGRINIRNVGDYYTFQIRDLRPSDAGTYHCALTHNVGATADLHVRSAPVFLKREYNGPYLLFGEGESRNLTCFAQGYPTPDIYWTRDENITAENIIAVGNVFKIRFVDRKTTRGRYYCLAQNTLGGVRRSIDVEVAFVPRLTVPRPIFGASLGHDTTLECLANGVPPPHITWMKGSTVIQNDRDYTLSYERSGEDNLTNATLSIRAIKEKQFGVYTCKAENGVGASEGRVSVLQNVFQVYSGLIDSDGKSKTFPAEYGRFAKKDSKLSDSTPVPAEIETTTTTRRTTTTTTTNSLPFFPSPSPSLEVPTESESETQSKRNTKVRKVLKLVGRRRKIDNLVQYAEV